MRGRATEPPVDLTIETLLRIQPNAARVFLKHGMACVGCPMAAFETVAEAAREYGVDLGVLLSELQTKCSVQRQRRNSGGANEAGP